MKELIELKEILVQEIADLETKALLSGYPIDTTVIRRCLVKLDKYIKNETTA